ncbi:hypothetical protein GCM10027256_13830 [Novispirillum itersonii subsp. nipponicum]
MQHADVAALQPAQQEGCFQCGKAGPGIGDDRLKNFQSGHDVSPENGQTGGSRAGLGRRAEARGIYGKPLTIE